MPKLKTGGRLPIGTKSQYDNVVSIYQSLVSKGVDPQAALDLVNQKVAEKGWTGYATGDNKKFNNVDQFTDHLIDWHSRMYPDSLKAKNFNDYWKGIMITPKNKYNPRGNAYKKELLLTRPGVKKRINFYRKQQGLNPLALVEPNNNLIQKGQKGFKTLNQAQQYIKDKGLTDYGIFYGDSGGEYVASTLPEVTVVNHKQTLFNNILDQLRNMTLTAAIAENPSVATASGWSTNSKTGETSQHKPIKSEKELGKNLFTLGEAMLTAPTLSTDIGVIYNAIRHPINTIKTISNVGKDIYWFLKHPGFSKVYHVNRRGKMFDLKEAKTASPSNIGIHVTSDKNIAKTFNSEAPVMEAYIPKADMETIDIGANDYRLLSNNYRFDARPEESSNFYDAPGDPQLLFKLFKKYGAEPTKVGRRIYTKHRVTIPLRDETWPNMPWQAKQQADKIIEEGNIIDFRSTPQQWDQKATMLNQRANDVLSSNGKKVIKYTNTNPYEVRSGDGTSFIVTDPSVFYTTKSTAQQRSNFINLLKYPFMYGLSKQNQ